jgi:hypothetical protein
MGGHWAEWGLPGQNEGEWVTEGGGAPVGEHKITQKTRAVTHCQMRMRERPA